MAPPLTAALKQEYQQLWESCFVRPAKLAAADAVAVKIGANRDRYQTVAASSGAFRGTPSASSTRWSAASTSARTSTTATR